MKLNFASNNMYSVQNKYKKFISSQSVRIFGNGQVFKFFIKKKITRFIAKKDILQQPNNYSIVFLLNTKACMLFLW